MNGINGSWESSSHQLNFRLPPHRKLNNDNRSRDRIVELILQKSFPSNKRNGNPRSSFFLYDCRTNESDGSGAGTNDDFLQNPFRFLKHNIEIVKQYRNVGFDVDVDGAVDDPNNRENMNDWALSKYDGGLVVVAISNRTVPKSLRYEKRRQL
ncbi:ADIPOR-like receptor [Sarcoptes scabiei]|nr:ADIPOR-like receptor [Sarcoptes scabiei]